MASYKVSEIMIPSLISNKVNQMKICTICNIEKELSLFNKRKAAKDGHTPSCKECAKISSAKYYKNNKSSIREKNKKWYGDNKEERKKSIAKYREANIDHLTEMSKLYVKNNKQKTEEYRKQYNIDNREKIATWHKNYMKLDSSKMKARNNQHKRRVLKYSASDGTVPLRVRSVLTDDLYSLLKRQDYKCNNCRCELTEKNRNLDHHIPLSKGGEHSIHNVVWLCEYCNKSKGNTVPKSKLVILS